jgi:uridine kinase
MVTRDPDLRAACETRLSEQLRAAGLRTDDIEALAPSFRFRQVAGGEIAYAAGKPSKGVGLLLDGEVELELSGLVFSREGPGAVLDSMGALSPGSVLPVTCRALGPCTIGELSSEALEDIERTAPRALLRLHRFLATEFVDELASRLRERPQALDMLLLPEPVLQRHGSVRVRVEDSVREVPTGVRAGALLPEMLDGDDVVAATIDTYVSSLGTPVTSPCSIHAVTTGSVEGRKVVRRSLGLLALEALGAVLPEATALVEGSIGFGILLAVPGADDLEDVGRRAAAHMRRLVDARAELREEWWTVPEARARLRAQGWTLAADLLGYWPQHAVPLVAYGQLYAIPAGPMLPDAGALAGFRLFARDGHLVLIPPPRGRESLKASVADPDAERAWDASAAETADHITRMTAASHRWLGTLGVQSVASLNRACVDGSIHDLIQVAEGSHERRVTRIADAIAESGAHIACLAGPSSSGKTTTLARLRVQLQVAGINPIGVSLDDYYVDREKTPRDERGEYDFESFEALRTDLLQGHLGRLVAGEEVTTARFDFVEGKSYSGGGQRLRIGERDLVILEGIHALNPRLLDSLPSAEVFRIYVCPQAMLPFDRLTSFSATDLRLIRRTVRDRRHRGTSATDSIARWGSVRRGERLHIFPYQHLADETFDTSLVYEPAVLRVFAGRTLLEVPQEHPSYPTAFRLLQLLNHFVAIHPDAVPPTSLLQEFISER